jgi:hypothetical protein
MWLNFWMVSFEVHALVFIRIQVLECVAFEDKGTMLCRNIGSHSPEDAISHLRRPEFLTPQGLLYFLFHN